PYHPPAPCTSCTTGTTRAAFCTSCTTRTSPAGEGMSRRAARAWSAPGQLLQLPAQVAVDGLHRETLLLGIRLFGRAQGGGAHCVRARGERKHADQDGGDHGDGQLHALTFAPRRVPSTFLRLRGCRACDSEEPAWHRNPR